MYQPLSSMSSNHKAYKTRMKKLIPGCHVDSDLDSSGNDKGKSKSEDVDLTVDAHQLKRYCIDAVKMFIKENIVTLDETWSPVVAQRKDVDKEIRRLADYCGVVPGVVDKKMRTHFDGL